MKYQVAIQVVICITGLFALACQDSTTEIIEPDVNPIHPFEGKIASATHSRIYVIDKTSEVQIWAGEVLNDGRTMVPRNLRWSPDGSQLMFIRNNDKNPHDVLGIQIINSDGSVYSTPITNTMVTGADWSLDGEHIVYGIQNGPGTGVVVAYSLIDRREDTLTSDGYWGPDCSPVNSNEILFTLGDIYLFDSETGSTTNLTNRPAWHASPRWSRDGYKIAFVRGWINDSIFVMNRDGSESQFITRGSYPTWSPDNQSIAYEYLSRLRLINLDTRQDTVIHDAIGRSYLDWY